MADQDQYGDAQSRDLTPERRQYQQLPQRSAASTNWRMKDGSPRAEPQPRMRQQRQGFGSPQQFNEQPREVSDTRLYVGNLLYSATKNDIMQFFIDNGFNPTNLTMSVDPETGRNPSYCFADFETSDEASRAINELNGQDLLGRTVRISPGVARKHAGEEGAGRQYSSPRSWGQQQQDGSRQAFGGYNRSDGYSSYNRNRDQESSGPVKKLYVGGLPDLGDQTEVEKSMKSLFDQFGIQLTYVSRMIAPHESKASEPGDHFYCFVELARPEDVEVAIESLDQKPSPYAAEGTLRVNKAKEQTRRPGGGAFGNQGGGFKDRRADGTRDWRTPRESAPQ